MSKFAVSTDSTCDFYAIHDIFCNLFGAVCAISATFAFYREESAESDFDWRGRASDYGDYASDDEHYQSARYDSGADVCEGVRAGDVFAEFVGGHAQIVLLVGDARGRVLDATREPADLRVDADRAL